MGIPGAIFAWCIAGAIAIVKLGSRREPERRDDDSDDNDNDGLDVDDDGDPDGEGEGDVE